ncbi:molybdenum cofactor biosynthesis protein [Pseudohyphozyma bogoriensis]|nr:molybdenum cofactor biosynthesis protein [Pseudohyphozyma bogoriensis]
MRNHKPTYTPETQQYLDWYNTRVPLWLYSGLLGMCLVFGLINWANRAYNSYAIKRYYSLHRPPRNLTSARMGRTSVQWLPSAVMAMWRKQSAGRARFSEVFGMGSPSQLAVIVVFYLLNFCIAFFGADGHMDYQAHHCARLFNSNIPLLIGLAAKELSFISWITGFSYETLNVFHRWVARLVFVLSVVHIAGRTWVNDPPVNPSLPYQRYQIALSVHRPQVAPFTIFALLLYASDRGVRGASLIYYNFFKGVGPGEAPSAWVEILSEDTVRVSIKVAKKWAPGQHTFLHLPLLGAGGHPFSICSTYLPISHTSTSPPPLSGTQVLLIRVREGLTKKLFEEGVRNGEIGGRGRLLSGGENGEEKESPYLAAPLWPCWTEGPYGHNLRLHHYEQVLLIVGGCGCSFSTSLMMDLIRRAKEMASGGKRIVTKRLTLVWVIRDASHVEWIGPQLRDAITYAPPDFFDLRIHVTSSNSQSNCFTSHPSDSTLLPAYDEERAASSSTLTPTIHETVFDAGRDFESEATGTTYDTSSVTSRFSHVHRYATLGSANTATSELTPMISQQAADSSALSTRTLEKEFGASSVAPANVPSRRPSLANSTLTRGVSNATSLASFATARSGWTSNAGGDSTRAEEDYGSESRSIHSEVVSRIYGNASSRGSVGTRRSAVSSRGSFRSRRMGSLRESVVPEEDEEEAEEEAEEEMEEVDEKDEAELGFKLRYGRPNVAELVEEGTYCMPESGVPLLPKDNLLTTDEIERVAKMFVREGVRKIRLTGGEPTVRRDLLDVVERLGSLPLTSLGMTSNGIALKRKLPALVKAGLTHLNISLDTLDPFKFELMTRRRGFEAVMESLEVAQSLKKDGLSTKLNCVVIRGVNDKEVSGFVELTKAMDVTVRFIEYMPFEDNKWSTKKLVPSADLVSDIKAVHPTLEKLVDPMSDTTRSWRVPGYRGKVGFISSMSDHFCGECSRLRVGADGGVKVCLFGPPVLALRPLLRSLPDSEILPHIGRAVMGKKFAHDGLGGGRALARGRVRVPLHLLSSAALSTQLRHSSSSSRASAPPAQLTHIDPKTGKASMVSVSEKADTLRSATAEGLVYLNPLAFELVVPSTHTTSASMPTKKGDVFTVAQLAGIMGAKQTSNLIPLCHPLALSHISVNLEPVPEQYAIKVVATAECAGKTGVEMEALTAASVACLTVWDMCKAVAGKEMVIGEIKVTKKSGGKSGDWERED